MWKKFKLYIICVFIMSSFLLTSSCSYNYEDVYTEGQEIYFWDLTQIYDNKDLWYKDYDRVKDLLSKLSNYESKLNDSYKNFQYVIYLQEGVLRIIDKLYTYALLNYHQNTSDTTALDMKSKADSLIAYTNENLSFIEAEIRAMDEVTLNQYLEIPEMSIYKDYIDHINDPIYKNLTKEKEKLLSIASDLYSIPKDLYETYIYQFNFPIQDFNKADLFSEDREIRKEALTKYYDKRIQGINILAETLESQVAVTTFIARAKGFETPLDAAMHKNNLTSEDYEKLIVTTENNLKPFHKWISIRKNAIGLKEEPLKIYDLQIPIIDKQSIPLTTYEDAKDIIYKSLSPLGKDYRDALTMAFNNQWIFPIPTEHKYNGAYTINIYDVHPFILLNYYGNINSIKTLSHELGHAMHFYFSSKKQPYVNCKPSIYTAEVTSTTNEILLLEYMLNNAKSDEERLVILYEYIQLISNTLYNQVLGAEFEKVIYDAYLNDIHLDADFLNSTWSDLQQKYYGKDFEPEIISSTTWAEIPHFYSSYYVYQYATGITAGLYFGQEISTGDKNIIEKYMKFISSGSSDEALVLLNEAGIDMKSDEPYKVVFKKYSNLVDEFDRLYSKINR